MSKEFMKIGPITCSIQADPPYKKKRNSKIDFFTLANEKPKLPATITTKPLERGNILYKATSTNFAVRTNQIGSEILENLTGKKTIEKIATELSEKYDYDDEEFIEQVKTFLNIFRAYQLL
jgi:hypothetical protein